MFYGINLNMSPIGSGPSRRGVKGGKRFRAWVPKGPVNSNLSLLYISAVPFYDNLSTLNGYFQEPLTMMTSVNCTNKTTVLLFLFYRNFLSGSIPMSQSLVS